MLRTATCLLAGLSFSMPCLGRDGQENSWENLKELRAGEKVQVVTTDLKKMTGAYVGVSEDHMTLTGPSGELAIQRARVLRVSAHGGRQRRMWTGLVIGAVAGLVTGALVDYKDDVDSSDRGSNNGKIGSLLFFAAVGAGTGAAIPGFRVVYRAATPEILKGGKDKAGTETKPKTPF